MSNNISQANNKRIAKNTLMLYVRMLISMAVGLYTSRVVLQVLGVEDYGIYGLVGGVVGLFAFLNASMSGATSRFLTFELGRGDEKKLADTFSMAFWEHLIIAGIVFIIIETFGIWFLNYKLVIPESRMFAANVLLQLSAFSMAVSVTQVPYNASIIAHEKMDVFAYIELVNVFLKLVIAYLLLIGNIDKLIFYGILTLAVAIVVASIYRIYCIRHFKECHIRCVWRKDIFMNMFAFSGWDLYGNMSVTLRQQGTNMLINMFFGVVFNAASALASTVMGISSGLSFNIVTAFRPQIIKNYAIGNYEECNMLLYRASKFTALLYTLIAIPAFFKMDFLLSVWLTEVPPMCSTFCRFLLVSSCFTMFICVLSVGIHATGNIKRLSFLSGSCFLMALPIIYVGYKLGVHVQFSYEVGIAVAFTVMTINLTILKHQIPYFSIRKFLVNCFIPILLVVGSSTLGNLVLNKYIGESTFWWNVLAFILSIVISAIAITVFGLTNAERKMVIVTIMSKISKK